MLYFLERIFGRRRRWLPLLITLLTLVFDSGLANAGIGCTAPYGWDGGGNSPGKCGSANGASFGASFDPAFNCGFETFDQCIGGYPVQTPFPGPWYTVAPGTSFTWICYGTGNYYPGNYDYCSAGLIPVPRRRHRHHRHPLLPPAVRPPTRIPAMPLVFRERTVEPAAASYP